VAETFSARLAIRGLLSVPGSMLSGHDLAEDGVQAVASLLTVVTPDVVINCAGATAGSPDALALANVTAVHALVRLGPLGCPRPLPEVLT
jgi:hypothetical protein